MAEGGKKLLTTREAARLLGIHENTMRAWADSGRVPAIRRPGGGGLRRFDPEVIERIRREMGFEEGE